MVQLAHLDGEFHAIIFMAANSRILRHVLTSLHQNARRARRSSLTAPSRADESLQEHRAVFQALEAHDPERAKSAMEKHVKNAHRYYDLE